jgi:hypothetical protein
MGALCCVVLLLLIGPGPILFDENKLIDRDVPAIQKNKSVWPQQLIDKASLMPLSHSKSEFIIYAPSNIGNNRLSPSNDCFTSLNLVVSYYDPAANVMPYGFSGRNQNAWFGRREFSAALIGATFSSLVDNFVQLPIRSHKNRRYIRVNEYRWSTTRVDDYKMNRKVYVPIFAKKQWRQDLSGVNRYPWPICGVEFVTHGIQLAFHCGCLFLQSSNGLTGFLVGAAHGAPLQNGYAKSEKASYGKSYSRDDQPFRYSYK